MLVDLILNAPGVLDKVRTDPENTLRKLAAETTKQLPPPPLVRNSGIYYVVVGSLGAVSITAAIGAIYLAVRSVQIPDILTALGSAAIGALAGLLAPSPATK
jgi:hypothetical protein